MKRILIVAFIIIAIVVGLIVVSKNEDKAKATKKEQKKQKSFDFGPPIKPLAYEDSLLKKFNPSIPKQDEQKEKRLSGQNVIFKVSGELKAGEINLRVGSVFKFNDFLCKIDETKLFIQIADEKEQLLEASRAFMQDCSQQFPHLAAKWESYFEKIDQAKRLPELPLIDEEFEADLVTEHKIQLQHEKIQELQNQIENYYFLAPFDGVIVDIRKKVGSAVKKGEVVLVIQKMIQKTPVKLF